MKLDDAVAEPARSPLPPLAAPDWTEKMDQLAEFLLYHHDPVAVERLAWRLLGLARRQQGVACRACQGRGQAKYAHSSTWKGGQGSDGVCILDVCDTCWGTGRTDRTGMDLRAQRAALQRQEQEASSHWLKQRLGAGYASMRACFPLLADRLRRLRFAKGTHYSAFWAGQTAELLAGVLEELAQAEPEEINHG